jgi:sodium-dependent dicarboxylate transporter 2/3/5
MATRDASADPEDPAAAMMLPIGLAVGEMFRPQDHKGPYEFGIALMLGVAYAASIGGVSTLIGTPPNAVLAAAASEILGVQIGFVQWMGVGLPIAAVMLPITWIVLTRFLYPPGNLTGDAAAIIEGERRALGKASTGEKVTAAVFVLTALAWVLRSEKTLGGVTIPGLQTLAPELNDSTIAMIAAAVLFVIPVDWRRRGRKSSSMYRRRRGIWERTVCASRCSRALRPRSGRRWSIAIWWEAMTNWCSTAPAWCSMPRGR